MLADAQTTAGFWRRCRWGSPSAQAAGEGGRARYVIGAVVQGAIRSWRRTSRERLPVPLPRSRCGTAGGDRPGPRRQAGRPSGRAATRKILPSWRRSWPPRWRSRARRCCSPATRTPRPAAGAGMRQPVPRPADLAAREPMPTRKMCAEPGHRDVLPPAERVGRGREETADRENSEGRPRSSPRSRRGTTRVFILADLKRSEAHAGASRLAYAVHQRLTPRRTEDRGCSRRPVRGGGLPGRCCWSWASSPTWRGSPLKDPGYRTNSWPPSPGR